MYCKNCGTEMTDDAKFCAKCGQKVDAIEKVKESQENQSPNSEKAKSKQTGQQGKKKKGSAMKVIGWILGIIGGLFILFVALVLLLPAKDNAAEPVTKVDFVGVWQSIGSADNIDGDVERYEPSDSQVYTVVFEANKLINVEVDGDGAVLSGVEAEYVFEDNHLNCQVTLIESGDAINIRMFINDKGQLMYTQWANGAAASTFTVCELTDFAPEDFLSSGDTLNTLTPEQEALLNNIAEDVEAEISEYKWEMNGGTVDAVPDDTLPDEYPRTFAPVKGEAVYTFDTTAKTLTMTQYKDGEMVNQVVENYDMIEPSTIYAFRRTKNIDGQDREMASAYFVSNGILYECEVMDETVSSNFIAYDNIGSATLTVDDLAAGLDRNFEASASGRVWSVSGTTVDAVPNADLPAGYPRVFDLTAGETTYEFDADSNTLIITAYDEDGVQAFRKVVPYEVINDTYIAAFKRTETIQGAPHELKSVYFISNGILYECEALDGVDASNYIAYTDIGPSLYSPQTEIDRLVAGLSRDIEAALANSSWESAGDSLPAMANADLPQGYPRFLEVKTGTQVYSFDTAKKKLTLTVYDEEGKVTDTVIKNYTLINNTYISAFERTQEIDGKTREVKSVYFISDGVLYECEVIDGIDASSYIAFYQLN